MRLIEHDDDALSFSRRSGEHLVELLRQFAERGFLRDRTQLEQDGLKQFDWIGLRLKQEGGMSRAAKSLQEVEEQRGLAHPGLGHEYLESEAAIDPVDQRGQRLSMGLAEKQETGIRGNAKRVLPQPEMADELTLY